jgi:methionyl aminopeptidase
MVVKRETEVDLAVEAAQRVVDMHRRLVEYLRAGLTLPEIDGFVARVLDDLRCRSCFLGYKIRGHPPFPSHSCLSVNDCIVHGTHLLKQPPLKPGDIISIDIGVKYKGWVGDAAWTYAIEWASDRARNLMACGREALGRGIKTLRAGRPLSDWARAVQHYVESECGFHLVLHLGGHGYGTRMHGAPFVSNVIPDDPREWPDASHILEPGTLLAVEPMVAMGTNQTRSVGRDWPIWTADGSLAVHYEADVLVTEFGPRNLTEGLFELPDIVGAGGR